MQWYDEVMDRIEDNKAYSHKELIHELKELKPDLSDNTYHWTVCRLVREGKLFREGYDTYCRPYVKPKDVYVPFYSDEAVKLMKEIREAYTDVPFVVFETVLMNDFLIHLIARNTIIIQVEKYCSRFVFRYLQDLGYQNLLYKPSDLDYSLYWTPGTVIITDLISEAPLRAGEPEKILLEKMLVDMVADKQISTTFSRSDLPDVFDVAQYIYVLDKVRMLRYARRRNRQKKVLAYLEGDECF